ncbi:aminopeptidase [Helicobacter cetorum]|uniref:X-Pro aminopeptidase n=1 Tax=Helicobacter cetorum (strain ATCC BAA-540 / CCUG 52418 / MIT 99-5656) TaxID=1163745 RepID=I0ETG3_HELCM|nr:aminopeptidase [Helicobacter cetorum]AFI06232.1 X-Pro aminopeptidase [Helicobacter cetorum MIT 99-5656]
MRELARDSHFTLNENAMFFECAYSCDNALFLRLDERAFFITDSRYTQEAKESIQSKNGILAEVIETSDLVQGAIDLILKSSVKKLFFDPNQVNLQTYRRLDSAIGTKITLEGVPNYHRQKRIIKSEHEIKLLKKSQALNVEAFENFAEYVKTIFSQERLLSEQFLQHKVKDFLTRDGLYNLSFEPILALNANASKPHALPSAKDFLKATDSVLLDMGIKYERYCSDRTRTAFFDPINFSFKREQSFKDKEHQKIYDVVKKAQERAISGIRAGMTGKEADSLARGVIVECGYGEYFTHSTGHGIGLDIHELPYISSRSETILEEGMVFSVEPGIYIPGFFGVRIEDLVVIKNSKAEIL